MAVCDSAPLPQLSSSSRNTAVKDHDEDVSLLRENIDEPAESNRSADDINTSDVCAVREGHAQVQIPSPYG